MMLRAMHDALDLELTNTLDRPHMHSWIEELGVLGALLSNPIEPGLEGLDRAVSKDVLAGCGSRLVGY